MILSEELVEKNCPMVWENSMHGLGQFDAWFEMIRRMDFVGSVRVVTSPEPWNTATCTSPRRQPWVTASRPD